MIRRAAGVALPVLLPLALAACNRGDDIPVANQTGPVKIQGSAIVANRGGVTGTPMKDRVAVVGLLNKRNGETRNLTMKPGEALRAGDAIVRLRACEQTAPWEDPPETGAFVQLDVRSTADNKWRRAFSGWLFKNRPEHNVVQHPIYDVWVRSCTMEWPETGPDTVKLSGPKSGASSSGTPADKGEKADDAAGPGPSDSKPPPAASGTPATAAPSNDR